MARIDFPPPIEATESEISFQTLVANKCLARTGKASRFGIVHQSPLDQNSFIVNGKFPIYRWAEHMTVCLNTADLAKAKDLLEKIAHERPFEPIRNLQNHK